MDKAGRLVIPKALRDQVGLVAGEVELVLDGAGIKIEPATRDDLVEEGGRLFIPAGETRIDDELVRKLRDAGRR